MKASFASCAAQFLVTAYQSASPRTRRLMDQRVDAKYGHDAADHMYWGDTMGLTDILAS